MVGLGPPRLATLRDIVTNRPPTTPLSFPSTCKVEAGLIKTICRASSGNRTHKSARASAPAAVDRYELVKHLYFEMLFTGGDYSLARKILDPHIVHR